MDQRVPAWLALRHFQPPWRLRPTSRYHPRPPVRRQGRRGQPPRPNRPPPTRASPYSRTSSHRRRQISAPGPRSEKVVLARYTPPETPARTKSPPSISFRCETYRYSVSSLTERSSCP